MPTVATKTDVLEGRAQVVSYTRDTSAFYLRVRAPEKGSYKTRRIPAADTVQKAVEAALDTFLEMGADATPRRGPKEDSTPKRQRIDKWIGNYIDSQQELSDTGVIKPLTFINKKQTLLKHIAPYCEWAGIVRTTDVKVGSFDRYQSWRNSTADKVPTSLTLKKEAAVVANLVSYLVKNRLLDPYEAAQKSAIPPRIRIVDSDYSANPPIRDNDEWHLLLTEVRRWVKEAYGNPKPLVLLHRRMFWSLLLFLKQTGMRPVEARNLRWCDVETEDIGRFSTSQEERVSRYVTHSRVLDSKTGAIREVTSNSAQVLARWKAWQREHLRVMQGKSVNGYRYELQETDLVFGIPKGERVEISSYNTLNKNWLILMGRLNGQLKGPVLSKKPYTIYSLRSTRAQELMDMGVDVYLAATQLGHTVAMLEKVYARLPQRRRATEEAAHIEFGKRKSDSKLVTLEEVSNDN